MNPNNIFSLFESEQENPKEETTKEITDLSEHPYVLLGLFTRMILRGESAVVNSIEFLKVLNPDINYEDVKKFNTYMIFTGSFNYLTKLSLEDPFHQDVILEKANDDFLLACSKSISFFSESEEYEKCALIKNFVDFINFSQNKLPL